MADKTRLEGRAMDLNSDLGEGFGPWTMGDDKALLEVVTSANIACGFHAGDPTTMRRTVELAAERDVRIGAHVSYPDRRGFGRVDMELPPQQIRDDVLYQIGALHAVTAAVGTEVAYVKPHGALYNRIARDPVVAEAVVSAIRSFEPAMSLLTQPGSAAHEVADSAGLGVATEGFADRGYLSDGRLVPRSVPGAVITDIREVSRRVVTMATRNTVTTTTGEEIELRVDSLCLHGDTPGAVELARTVRESLEQAGVVIRPFVREIGPLL